MKHGGKVGFIYDFGPASLFLGLDITSESNVGTPNFFVRFSLCPICKECWENKKE